MGQGIRPRANKCIDERGDTLQYHGSNGHTYMVVSGSICEIAIVCKLATDENEYWWGFQDANSAGTLSDEIAAVSIMGKAAKIESPRNASRPSVSPKEHGRVCKPPPSDFHTDQKASESSTSETD